MSIQQALLAMVGAADTGAYQINQSLRFDGSAYLSRSGTIKGASTFSVWIKRGRLNDTFGVLGLRAGSTSNYKQLFYEGSGYDSLGFDNSSGGNAYSNNKFRDASGWYHVVVVSNTTGTGSRMYINGQEVSYRIQTTTTSSDTTGTIYVGALNTGGSPFDGYMAECHLVDSALTPSSFGETDTITGAWIPKRYSGSYGTNGFYLKFDPAATNGIGHDHSGNGNNFTATGFSTSGTGTDVMSDTPTTNWCTLNPIGTTYGFQAPTDGNLKTDSGTSGKSTEGTFAIPQDGNLYYFEGTMTRDVGDGGTTLYFGVHTQGTTANPIASDGKYLGIYGTDGAGYDGLIWIQQWSDTPAESSYVYGHINAGTVWSCAVKYVSGTWKFYVRQGSGGWWYYNGSTMTYLTTFDETKPSASYATNDVLVPIGNNIIFNFGQRAFEYTPPTGGYKALNTANLPEPTIKDGGKYFATTLWTGNSATRTITVNGIDNVGFAWLKARSINDNHTLANVVVGGDKYLKSNSTDAELSSSLVISAISSNTFTVGSDAQTNRTGDTYVGWTWAAGGAGSSNNAGTITSTVSANASAGFSIVTYTGTGANATVGHGLGVAPKMIIFKNRDELSHWDTYHASVGATKRLQLSSTGAASTLSTPFNDTEPTSTVFSVGTNLHTNGSGDKLVAYCFSEVAGYSKFGSYTGGGAPFIYTGFRPAFLLIKSSNESTDWVIMDTARSPYNLCDEELLANSSIAERSDAYIDILSNGFVLKNGAAATNAYQHIYAAFAELPFKYSTAR